MKPIIASITTTMKAMNIFLYKSNEGSLKLGHRNPTDDNI